MAELFPKWAPRPPMPLPTTITPALLARYEREFEKANERSLGLAAKRMTLPEGSSRARITTLNAKWSIAAEHRDRLLERLERARAMCIGREPPHG